MTRITRIQNGRASTGPDTPNLFFLQKTTRLRPASEGLRRGRQREERLSFAGTKRSLRCLRFLLFKEVPTFPRNLALPFVLYIGERPEIISQ
jgi:hypothetical protein